eukprot:TRINITY_DN79903_c0_g1_i1.p1 TRINITY_DN79903_c0_g1~~TRINITY_DN79903_c0_g1_i1.p1  ORF type:complete len:393 (+),score=59.13 TRINITY_DN79903_c0_g1_i1:90-1181(+)
MVDQALRDLFFMPARATQDLATKSWYTTNFRAIRDLVGDPNYETEPDPDEPVLEVVVGDAKVEYPPHFKAVVMSPTFIRVSMDHDNVGETTLCKQLPYTHPSWHERFLLIPRGSNLMRFQVVDTRNQVRCYAALGVESLWRTVDDMGCVSLKLPLQQDRLQLGHLQIHVRMWDRLPLPETPWWLPQQMSGQPGTTSSDVLGDMRPPFSSTLPQPISSPVPSSPAVQTLAPQPCKPWQSLPAAQSKQLPSPPVSTSSLQQSMPVQLMEMPPTPPGSNRYLAQSLPAQPLKSSPVSSSVLLAEGPAISSPARPARQALSALPAGSTAAASVQPRPSAVKSLPARYLDAASPSGTYRSLPNDRIVQ